MLLRRGTRAFAAQAHPPPLFDGQAATPPGASAALSPDSFFLRFVNHEARGVPAGAAADGPSGFPLARMEALLEALGSPHAQYPVVHVGGSKGKGSVVALVSAALRANGLSVATYTSPHAFESRERLTLGLSSGPVPVRAAPRAAARPRAQPRAPHAPRPRRATGRSTWRGGPGRAWWSGWSGWRGL